MRTHQQKLIVRKLLSFSITLEQKFMVLTGAQFGAIKELSIAVPCLGGLIAAINCPYNHVIRFYRY